MNTTTTNTNAQPETAPRRYPHLTGKAAWLYIVGPTRCAECGSPAQIYMPMMGAHLCEPCHQTDPDERPTVE